MNIVQYIIANQGIGMSPGKLAAQVAHAAVKSFEISQFSNRRSDPAEIMAAWNATGHTKIVLAARDTEHLLAAEKYLRDRGHRVALIVDEGRTEVPSLTPTALGVELLDRDDPYVKFSFSTFKTYKEPQPQPLPKPRSAWLRQKRK